MKRRGKQDDSRLNISQSRVPCFPDSSPCTRPSLPKAEPAPKTRPGFLSFYLLDWSEGSDIRDGKRETGTFGFKDLKY